MPTTAEHIAIMAHSYGGVVVVDGVCTFTLITFVRAFITAMMSKKIDPNRNSSLSPFQIFINQISSYY